MDGKQNPDEHNPQLLKIYADNQSKKHQVFQWGIFFFITFTSFIVVNFLPKPIQSIQETSNFCTNPIEVANNTREVTCEPFNLYQRCQKGLAVENLTTLNQFLVLNAYFYVKNTQIDLDYTSKANVTLYKLTRENGKRYAQKLANKTVQYSLTTGKSTKFFSDQGKFIGFYVQLFYVRNLQLTDYLFVVSFPTQPEALANLQNLKIQASVINKPFSIFSIALRFVLLSVAMAALFLYIGCLRRVQRKYLVLQQKFALVLGIEMILFNDPFYIITITMPNDASNFFSVLFIILPVCTLLFYWVCIFQRIDTENGQVRSNVLTKKKLVLFFFGFLSILGYYLYFSYRHNSDPFVDISELSQGLFYFLLVLSVIFTFASLLKIISDLIKICKDYESKIWRNKILTNFSIFFVFCLFIFLFSNGFDVFSLFPNRVLIIFVQINMYVIYLMYMYAPTSDASQMQLGYHDFEVQSEIQEQIKTIHIDMNNREDDYEEERNDWRDDEDIKEIPSGKLESKVFEIEENGKSPRNNLQKHVSQQPSLKNSPRQEPRIQQPSPREQQVNDSQFEIEDPAEQPKAQVDVDDFQDLQVQEKDAKPDQPKQ